MESLLSSKPFRPPQVLHEAIEFLYEQASAQPDFDTLSVCTLCSRASAPHTCSPHPVHVFALKLIVKYFPGYDLSSPPVIPLLHRLIEKYPKQINPRVIAEFSGSLFKQYQDNHHVIRLLAMMGWLPYTSEACSVIYGLRFVIKESVALYIRNLKASGKITAPFLFDIMGFGGGTCDFWFQFVEDSGEDLNSLSEYLETLILTMDSRSQHSNTPLLRINHIRFLVWLHCRRAMILQTSTRSSMIGRALSICQTPHHILPTLLSHRILAIDNLSLRSFGLSLAHDLNFLRTVMWYSNVRPTQVCACLVGNAISYTRTHSFLYTLVWMYTVRVMIRERVSTDENGVEFRMILGPKAGPKPFLLPLSVTRLVVEFLWQGPCSFGLPGIV
jgi:hypothetical protein